MEIQSRLAPHGIDVGLLPRSWERLGDVLVLRGIRRRFGAQATIVAEVYGNVLGARLVLEDTHGVQGQRREPTMVRLWGTGSGETTLVQDRIRYTFDAQRLMFSSGNLPERERMGRIDAHGEHVVDLFAGIGYFTLPLLVHGKAKQVTACELNPLAAHYLARNAKTNQVGDALAVRVGDCRSTAPRQSADRVVSGWFPHGHRYLDVALDTLRAEGGMLHYHDTAHADHPEEELYSHLEDAAAATGRAIDACHVRIVKSFSPGVVHAVADVQLGPVADASQRDPLAVTPDMKKRRPGGASPP